MQQMEEIELFVNQHKGRYYVISPYHKNRKKLPFIITGLSYNTEYPVSVQTVEYKGWKRHYINTAYSIESIRSLIDRGIIHREAHP